MSGTLTNRRLLTVRASLALLATFALSPLVVMPARASGAAPLASSLASSPRIVTLGDSLTSGRGIGRDAAYPAVLQMRLDEEGLAFEVVNAGVSGATSADGARRLASALEGDVRVLVIALGANDGVRGVPVPRMKANLSGIIKAAQSRGIAVLLCGMDALPLYGWNYTVEFHKAFEELAQEFDVPLVPYTLVGIIGNRAMMQRDGVHPNVEGAQALADKIWPYLKPLVAAEPAAK